MALKGGTFFFLLIVTCAAFAIKPDKKLGKKQNFRDMARKMMKECKDEGYQEPDMELLKTVFERSDVPSEDGNTNRSITNLPAFLSILNSVVPGKGSLSKDDLDEMKIEMIDRTDLANIIKRMKKSFGEQKEEEEEWGEEGEEEEEEEEDEGECYMNAYVAPQSLIALTEDDEQNIDSGDYDTLLTAVKHMVLDMPSSGMNLPDKLKGQDMKKWMMMLKELYSRMYERKKIKVMKWAKEQITQNYFNCTTMPESDPRSNQLERCKRSLKWLNSDTMEILGPFLFDLKTEDIDSIPKEMLCEFFSSAHLKVSLKMVKMKPSLADKFLQRVTECFPSEKRLEKHLEKLGKLACYYKPSQEMTLDPDLCKQFLSQVKSCVDDGNPRIKKLKKNMVNIMASNGDIPQALQVQGVSLEYFSTKHLNMIPSADIKKALKKLRPDVKWTCRQQRVLVKKILGKKKCKEITSEELMDVSSIARYLPRCVLKQVQTRELLNNTEGLKTACKRMRKGQLKTVLQSLRKNMDPSVLLEKLPGPLLRSMPLKYLKNTDISLEQLKSKTWSKAQALFLMKRQFKKKKKFVFRKLRSLLRGVTCEMVKGVSFQDLKDMVQDKDNARWLSKVLAGCAARKLFADLEKVRPDYFKKITEEELEDIPSTLLPHLMPKKVEDLPDSVCPVLLDKMENADLSSLPLHARSRLALTKRALLYLTKGKNSSELDTKDIEKLGPFLCELSPSEMQLMKKDVLTFSLEEMALRCRHIPRRHVEDLIQLVLKIYGSVSTWSAKTMEELGPVIMLDDKVISTLPNKPWMKDVLCFLKSQLPNVSPALEKKIFDLTVDNTLDAARRKRTVEDRNAPNVKEPTAAQIEDLNLGNVYWSPSQLEQISKETFIDTVEILGSVPGYNKEQLVVLTKKATEAFGPVSKMNENVVAQLGCITQGFSEEDLQTLPFSLDTLEEIAPCGWTELQLEKVWRAAAKYNNLTAEQLEDAEMVALNRFICGMNSNEMKQINNDTFKEAVDSINDLQCSIKCTQQLSRLAVSAYGPPGNWSEAQVSNLGNLMAGLDQAELASLDPSVLSFFSTSSIELIPPENFAVLSLDQLLGLGPDNAAMVTNDQRAALSGDQLSAVDSAMTGTEPDSRTGGQTTTTTTTTTTITTTTVKATDSGAPSLTVEGILSVVKPFLFLLMGFLLL